MKDLNTVTIIGRLTKDADIRYTNSGMAISSISIANNRSKKEGDQWVDETSFFNVTVFGKTAENLKQYLIKGKQVAISGFLKQERWEKDGKPESRVVILADDIQLIGGQNQQSSQGGYNQPQQNYQNTGYQPQPAYPQNGGYPQQNVPPQYQPRPQQYQPNIPPQVQNIQQTFDGEAFQEDILF